MTQSRPSAKAPEDTISDSYSAPQQHTIGDRLRLQLANADALPQLTLLGLICGILAALVIVAFRWIITSPLQLLPLHSENFEGLPPQWRFALPVAGATLLALIYSVCDKKYQGTGVSHVLDRLHNFQGRLPLGNTLLQFFGAAICLISGQSVGREGPSVHLGAGTGSALGQWLKLPNNSLRPLIACGVAAAIAASFNTPMAGLIFAMEVVLMEYTIAGFIPVMLAAVTGATVSRIFFGEEANFIVGELQISSLWELPYIACCGLVIAACAAVFIRLQVLTYRFHRHPIALRLIIAGLLTGCVALLVPQVMGMGYDTIEQAMTEQIGLQLLLLVIAAKLFVTAISLGLGMPGGVIGPSLVIGACIGGVLGICGQAIFLQDSASTGVYVMLGMGAMMAAVLNAPLAALIALLELTYNPQILFPGMLIIVVSCLCSRQAFRCEGIFQTQLHCQGKKLHAGIAHPLLARTGVASLMETHFISSSQQLTAASARQLLQHNPRWLLINNTDSAWLLAPADLAAHLDTQSDTDNSNSTELIDLLQIPGRRLQVCGLPLQANLLEAQQLLRERNCEALYVYSQTTAFSPAGVITRQAIEDYYHP